MTSPWQALRALAAESPRSLSVEDAQTRWLLACLERNQDTSFGRRYRFRDIRSIRDYQQRLPLSEYESFAPLIEQIAHGESDVLFRGQPVAFEKTGGSSGGAKLIPYSTDTLDDLARAFLPWLRNLIDRYDLTRGTAYWAVSPATRAPEITPGGISVGLPETAYLGTEAVRPLSALSATPPWIGSIQDISTWQRATLYWLVRRHDLALIWIWSPSFLLQLLDTLDNGDKGLKLWLESGTVVDDHALPPDHAAAKRLMNYFDTRDTRDLWPDLKLVSCWVDAASRPLADALQLRLPQARLEGKGLLATEGVTTVPNRAGNPVLALNSGFFEFLNTAEETQLAWELSPDEVFEVVLTSACGLYRYRTGDMVRYEGTDNGLSVLRFVGRGSLTSDLVGEKLTEAFVAQCLDGIPGFRTLLPVANPATGYTLVAEQRHAQLIDAKLPDIEQRLGANPQYAYARKLGQLMPLSVTYTPNPLGAYMRSVSQRQRLGDIKIPSLLPMGSDPDMFLEQSA